VERAGKTLSYMPHLRIIKVKTVEKLLLGPFGKKCVESGPLTGVICSRKIASPFSLENATVSNYL
jgi:hypothetical protein